MIYYKYRYNIYFYVKEEINLIKFVNYGIR